ncbi:hypothetical protein J3R30DRAFT_3697845 [Lentinula aciculospora]|uniref:Uncharacterized protein n=1 Tax=Lentinula aciculospora TaxID=153920 RepID=A0A9W9AMA6_9AGAR|nr:hypothetical protein J3R30DRAFT_3697845 [Lentinula aciculospora]
MSTAAVEPPPDGPLIACNDNEPEHSETASLSPSEVSKDVNKEPAQVDNQSSSSPSPSLRIYSRPQILALYKSPLVCVPPDMPELRDWFGAENEQNLSRKELDPTATNSGRERRFRRDGEENELPARPSFRSSISQPSQMGNFKHQSMRSNDRDLEREGQERLRNLSEKFDRDRLNGPLLNIRTEKRNVVATSSNRVPSQTQGTIAARRAETRETVKRKLGESNEDWRRSTENRRSERNDRGDRDERPRSRSRHRRDPSPTRRDREGKEREKERDDYRRERVDRDRDDDDDSRRWRDDGRRDERLVSRRERGPNGIGKDKESNSSNPNDRRWKVVEERDAKSKRNAGRDKKSFSEEGRTDDRRGDREKEKEPAWMDTYVPSSSTGGILGSKGNEGELDGIQAWKKNMKEKEQAKTAPPASEIDSSNAPSTTTKIEEPMDEIQRFKKMMEVAQKQTSDPPMIVGPIFGITDTPKSSSTRDKGNVTMPKRTDAASGVEANAAAAPSKLDTPSLPDPSRSLLSLLNSNNVVSLSSDTDSALPKLHSRLPLADSPTDRANSDTTFNPPQGSRLLALSNRAPAKPATPNSQFLSSAIPNGGPTSTLTTTAPKPQLPGFANLPNPLNMATEGSKVVPRTPSSFSPFEEQRELGDALRRQVGDRSPFITDSVGPWPDPSTNDPTTAGHAIGKGSRFAKFFDGKGKEAPITAPNIPKALTPVGFVSSSPGPHVRPDSGFGNLSNPILEQPPRTVDELFAKLNMNPLQSQRVISGSSSGSLNHAQFSQQAQSVQSQLHSLQQHQQQLQNQLHNAARLEPLYESRNFVPDNLVPGLRSAPPPRNRDNGGMYAADPLDDALLLNAHQQRLPVQQQRGVEQLYGGSIPPSYTQQQQLARNAGLPVQTPQFRGGPSPVSAPQIIHNAPQQRMPPGLANLGGRPPHDPAQFGIPGPLPSGLHINGPQQQQQSFNNFHPTAGFGGLQGPLRHPAHQLPNNVNHHQLAGLGHPGNLDSRSANQHAQLLAMSGLGGASGLRNISGSGGGFNHQAGNSLQNQMLVMRQQAQQQQQQQHIHPQMLPHHLLPPHIQQGPPVPPSQTTSAQDLMALLMGTHRD